MENSPGTWKEDDRRLPADSDGDVDLSFLLSSSSKEKPVVLSACRKFMCNQTKPCKQSRGKKAILLYGVRRGVLAGLPVQTRMDVQSAFRYRRMRRMLQKLIYQSHSVKIMHFLALHFINATALRPFHRNTLLSGLDEKPRAEYVSSHPPPPPPLA